MSAKKTTKSKGVRTDRKSTSAKSVVRAGDAEAETGADVDGVYRLRLYVAGQTPKSLAAFSNLKKLCEEYLPGRYKIEVIDLVENPQLAAGDQILALPTLVRKLPSPLKRIIGNLSDKEKFLVGMDLKPQS